MKLIALMTVLFFTLSSGTTFSQEDARRDIRYSYYTKSSNKGKHVHFEFRWTNNTNRKIRIVVDLAGGRNNRQTIDTTLLPGLNKVYVEDYDHPDRKIDRCKLISATFIQD